MTKIAFFDTKPYDKEFFRKINEEFGYEIKFFKEHLSPDTAVMAKGFDAVCAFVNDDLSEKTIDILEENGVKLIAMRCAGYNNVDMQAAFQRVRVARVPAYSPYAVAEHALAMLLTLNRKTHKAYSRTRDGNFAISGFLGTDMFGKTAGIIGTGKIGQIAAGILKGFGMNLLFFDPYPNEPFAEEIGGRYVDLKSLLQESDFITLHCPLTPETHHIIDEKAIAQMKDHVYIINTSRGGLIDTPALVEGLKSGKIGAAGLDVYEEESDYFFEDLSDTVIRDDTLARLLTFPNVLITSHQGFFTKEAIENISRTTLENVRQFFEDGKLDNEICYQCGAEPCPKKEGRDCLAANPKN